MSTPISSSGTHPPATLDGPSAPREFTTPTEDPPQVLHRSSANHSGQFENLPTRPVMPGLEQTQQPPRPRMNLHQYLASKVQQADALHALAPRDDRKFRDRIGPDSVAAAINTRTMHEQLTRLEGAIGDADIPPAAKKILTDDIANIRADISRLTDNKHTGAYVALAAVRLALTPLPLLEPLLAQPAQYHGAALIIASIFKTSIIAAGLAHNPLAHAPAVMNHAKNRDLANNLQALLLLVNIVPTATAKTLSESVAYNIVAGVVGFAALMLVFYGTDALKARGARKTLAEAALQLPLETRDRTRSSLTTHADDVDEHYKALQNERRIFKESGLRLTSTADRQVGEILRGMDTFRQHLLELASSDASNAAPAVPVRNEDKVGKAIMFGISALVLAAPVVPVTGLGIERPPETIPLVDLLIDYTFTMFHMGAIVRNPSASVQEAQEAFSQWVGFSGVMSYCFGANAALHDPVLDGGKSFAGFTVGLSVANSVFATPLGTTMADIVSVLFDKLRRNDKQGARRDLIELGEQITRQASDLAPDPHTGATASITDAPPADSAELAEAALVLVEQELGAAAPVAHESRNVKNRPLTE